jgi:hypothetical protein
MEKIDVTLGEILSLSPMGDPNNSMASALYGINHRSTPSPIPINKEQSGLVLFTRPQLNLQTQNVRALRQLIPLLNNEPASIQRMVRKLLDPRLHELPCPFVDQQLAFIPLLTNHCNSISGFPDAFVNSHISKPGAYKESFGMVDDVFKVYGDYDLNATFRNMPGDPVSLLFYVWCLYASYVAESTLIPYPDFIAKNTVDYNTRIWRILLDSSKRYVTRIACTGAAYPRSVPTGATLDFSSDEPFNSNNRSINIQFQAFGAIYNDPLLIHVFNQTVGIFNPSMRADSSGRPSSYMTQIPYSELNYFPNVGYPRIDPDTYEMQYWLPVPHYNHRKETLTRIMKALG